MTLQRYLEQFDDPSRRAFLGHAARGILGLGTLPWAARAAAAVTQDPVAPLRPASARNVTDVPSVEWAVALPEVSKVAWVLWVASGMFQRTNPPEGMFGTRTDSVVLPDRSCVGWPNVRLATFIPPEAP